MLKLIKRLGAIKSTLLGILFCMVVFLTFKACEDPIYYHEKPKIVEDTLDFSWKNKTLTETVVYDNPTAGFDQEPSLMASVSVKETQTHSFEVSELVVKVNKVNTEDINITASFPNVSTIEHDVNMEKGDYWFFSDNNYDYYLECKTIEKKGKDKSSVLFELFNYGSNTGGLEVSMDKDSNPQIRWMD